MASYGSADLELMRANASTLRAGHYSLLLASATSLPLRQLDRHMWRCADHPYAAVGVGLLRLDQRFQDQEEFLGKHGPGPFKPERPGGSYASPTIEPGNSVDKSD